MKGFLSGLQEVERVLDEASPVGARSRDDPLSYKSSVVDRQCFVADPDTNFHVDADPDPDPD